MHGDVEGSPQRGTREAIIRHGALVAGRTPFSAIAAVFFEPSNEAHSLASTATPLIVAIVTNSLRKPPRAKFESDSIDHTPALP